MKTQFFQGIIALALLSTLNAQLSTAHAQGTAFTYQGRVLDNGTNFNGAGQFQFALVTSTNASSQATATANAPSGGYITGYIVTFKGNGYVTAPAVTVLGGGGSGAVATAHLTGNTVTSLSVASPGDGDYTSAPTVLIAPPPPNVAYTTYWSNDGTSVNGSEPGAAVSVRVSNGLFTVVLGDTTQPNMTAIDASLFTQPNLQLRIWFNDGLNDFAAMDPAQNLTPTPYAIQAINATSASNLLGTLPATQLSGTIANGNLPSSINFAGTVTANSFSGNGAGVTNIQLASVGPAGLFGSLTEYFSQTVTVPAGTEPMAVVAITNLDGHGLTALVSANYNANMLTVLTNNGSGVFGSNATLAVGSGPCSVATADVNGDGKPDLISANLAANTLTVLTNNGSGAFGSNATVTVGQLPIFVLAADVNGDGKPDLISANYAGGTLTILTNNGSGVFGSNAAVNVGTYPWSVAAGDLNGDGKLDLISANSGARTLTVLTNNGSGVFGVNATLTVGSTPEFVATADVNGDGKLDLISANNGDSTLTVLTNNGSGVLSSNATLMVGSFPVSVAAADVNGDGHVDLISASGSYSGTLTVLTNNGGGIFSSNATLIVGSGPLCLITADVNGDGQPDLITANEGAGTLSVIYGFPRLVTVNGAMAFTDVGNIYNGTFMGSGENLSSLNANNLASGTVPDGRLSTNVALLNGTQVFTGQNTFSNTIPGGGVTLTTFSSMQSAFYIQDTRGFGYNATLGLAEHYGDYSSNATAGDVILRSIGGRLLLQTSTGVADAVISGGNLTLVGGLAVAKSAGVNGILNANQGLNVYNGDLDVVTDGINVENGDLDLWSGFAAKPGGGSWDTFSDERLKKNIHPLTGVLDKLMALHGVTFEYKDPQTIHELPGERIGMIAQAVEKVFPDWVSTATNGYKKLTYRGFEALTVEGLRELRAEKDAQIATLEKQNAEMAKELAEQKKISSQMEERLNQMEKGVARVTEKTGAKFATSSKAAENQ